MTYLTDCTLPEELLEQIAQQGLDVLPDISHTVINAAMVIERQNHLSAAPYERSQERQGHANGCGRVVGDGGCNFEVVDIAVHPEYQRQGLRGLVMNSVMSYIEENAPKTAYVSLIADHHSPALYSKFGFEPTAPVLIGMGYKV